MSKQGERLRNVNHPILRNSVRDFTVGEEFKIFKRRESCMCLESNRYKERVMPDFINANQMERY